MISLVLEHGIMLVRIVISYLAPEWPEWVLSERDVLQWRLEKWDHGIQDWYAKGHTLEEIRDETEQGINAELEASRNRDSSDSDDEDDENGLLGLIGGPVGGGLAIMSGMLSVVDPHLGHLVGSQKAHRHAQRAEHNKGAVHHHF